MYTSTMSIPQELVLRDLIREQLLQDPRYKNLKENIFLQEAKLNELFGMSLTDLGIMAGQIGGSILIATGIGVGAGIALNAAATIGGVYHYMTEEDGPDIFSAALTLIGGFTGGAGGIALKGVRPLLGWAFRLLGKGTKFGSQSIGWLFRQLSKVGGPRGTGWFSQAIAKMGPLLTKLKGWFDKSIGKAIDAVAGFARAIPSYIPAGLKKVLKKGGDWLVALKNKFVGWIDDLLNNTRTWSTEWATFNASYKTFATTTGRVIQVADDAGKVTINVAGRTHKVGRAFPNAAAGTVDAAKYTVNNSISRQIQKKGATIIPSSPGPSNVVQRWITKRPPKISFPGSVASGTAGASGKQVIHIELPRIRPSSTKWRAITAGTAAAYTRTASGESGRSDPITDEEIASMFEYGADFGIPEDEVFDVEVQDLDDQEQTQSAGDGEDDVEQTADEDNTSYDEKRRDAWEKLMNGELR